MECSRVENEPMSLSAGKHVHFDGDDVDNGKLKLAGK